MSGLPEEEKKEETFDPCDPPLKIKAAKVDEKSLGLFLAGKGTDTFIGLTDAHSGIMYMRPCYYELKERKSSVFTLMGNKITLAELAEQYGGGRKVDNKSDLDDVIVRIGLPILAMRNNLSEREKNLEKTLLLLRELSSQLEELSEQNRNNKDAVVELLLKKESESLLSTEVIEELRKLVHNYKEASNESKQGAEDELMQGLLQDKRKLLDTLLEREEKLSQEQILVKILSTCIQNYEKASESRPQKKIKELLLTKKAEPLLKENAIIKELPLQRLVDEYRQASGEESKAIDASKEEAEEALIECLLSNEEKLSYALSEKQIALEKVSKKSQILTKLIENYGTIKEEQNIEVQKLLLIKANSLLLEAELSLSPEVIEQLRELIDNYKEANEESKKEAEEALDRYFSQELLKIDYILDQERILVDLLEELKKNCQKVKEGSRKPEEEREQSERERVEAEDTLMKSLLDIFESYPAMRQSLVDGQGHASLERIIEKELKKLNQESVEAQSDVSLPRPGPFLGWALQTNPELLSNPSKASLLSRGIRFASRNNIKFPWKTRREEWKGKKGDPWYDLESRNLPLVYAQVTCNTLVYHMHQRGLPLKNLKMKLSDQNSAYGMEFNTDPEVCIRDYETAVEGKPNSQVPQEEKEKQWTEFKVPDNPSCLFLSVTLGVLIPVLDDPVAYEKAFNQLFAKDSVNSYELDDLFSLGEKEDNQGANFKRDGERLKERIRAIVKNENVGLERQGEGDPLYELIDHYFRQKVADSMNKEDAWSPSDPSESREEYITRVCSSNFWGGEQEMKAIFNMLSKQYKIVGSTFEIAGDPSIRLVCEKHLKDSKYRYNLSIEKQTVDSDPSLITATGAGDLPRRQDSSNTHPSLDFNAYSSGDRIQGSQEQAVAGQLAVSAAAEAGRGAPFQPPRIIKDRIARRARSLSQEAASTPEVPRIFMDTMGRRNSFSEGVTPKKDEGRTLGLG